MFQEEELEGTELHVGTAGEKGTGAPFLDPRIPRTRVDSEGFMPTAVWRNDGSGRCSVGEM